MNTISVYVCSPYSTAAEVRALHTQMRCFGIIPCSLWAEHALEHNDAEDFTKFSADELRIIAEANDADLMRADVVLVWSRETGGRETYAECARAQVAGKPVLWLGRRTLSAYRAATTIVEDSDEAIRLILAARVA